MCHPVSFRGMYVVGRCGQIARRVIASSRCHCKKHLEAVKSPNPTNAFSPVLAALGPSADGAWISLEKLGNLKTGQRRHHDFVVQTSLRVALFRVKLLSGKGFSAHSHG
jgi:hypothetical protein